MQEIEMADTQQSQPATPETEADPRNPSRETPVGPDGPVPPDAGPARDDGPALDAGPAPDAGPALDAGPAPEVLDLKGTPCPINYVKTKLVLEELGSGAVLQVLLDEGDPVKNVPRSLKDDGHEVLGIEKQDSHYVVTVKKK